jgi:hypothetical protein
MYASHASPRTPLLRFLQVVCIRGNLSRVINSVGQNHCSQEKGTPDYIPSTPADRSVCPHLVSLPPTTIEVVEKAKHLLTNKLHQFTGHISLACDQYVQYLPAGANPSVLNQHRRVIIMEVLACHITLPDLPNRRSSACHLWAPLGLRLSNINLSL